MPYYMDIPDTEQAYLDALPLSSVAQDRIREFIAGFIANVPDAFRNDPANRPSLARLTSWSSTSSGTSGATVDSIGSISISEMMPHSSAYSSSATSTITKPAHALQ